MSRPLYLPRSSPSSTIEHSSLWIIVSFAAPSYFVPASRSVHVMHARNKHLLGPSRKATCTTTTTTTTTFTPVTNRSASAAVAGGMLSTGQPSGATSAQSHMRSAGVSGAERGTSARPWGPTRGVSREVLPDPFGFSSRYSG